MPSRPLVLLFFADGTSVHTQRWLTWFHEAGHRVSLLSAVRWKDAPAGVQQFELTAICPQSAVATASDLLRSPASIVRLRRLVRHLAPDIVHAHYATDYGRLAWLAGRRPFVISAWGSDIFRLSGQSWRMRWTTRSALRAAAAVTGDSRHLIAEVERLGVPTDRTALISFGVDTTVFRPDPDAPARLRARLGLADDCEIILSPRSVSRLYNILGIVEAFAAARDSRGSMHLVIKDYKGDASYAAEVEREVDRRGLAPHVTWVPELTRHADLAELYQGCDVLVSFAGSDSAPVSVLEGLACGAWTVASDLPSIAALLDVADRKNLVAPDDVSGLTQALLTAPPPTDPRRAEWSRRYSRRIAEEAGVSGQMELAEQLYRRLIRRDAP